MMVTLLNISFNVAVATSNINIIEFERECKTLIQE
jgi:hypothetical protein